MALLACLRGSFLLLRWMTIMILIISQPVASHVAVIFQSAKSIVSGTLKISEVHMVTRLLIRRILWRNGIDNMARSLRIDWIQSLCIDMLEVLKEFCVGHNISFYMAGGRFLAQSDTRGLFRGMMMLTWWFRALIMRDSLISFGMNDMSFPVVRWIRPIARRLPVCGTPRLC